MDKSKISYYGAILFLLTFIVLAVVWSLQPNILSFKPESRPTIAIGHPVPDFIYPGLDGEMVRLSDYRGKVVLVNIWATWCRPCVEEMPSMERLYQKLKAKKFEILAVSIDSLGLKAVAPFMQKYKLTFPALTDPKGTIARTYKTTGVPESFIIGKDGKLIKKIIGPLDWAHPKILGFFNELIQKPWAG
jgi:peroxiredoxin